MTSHELAKELLKSEDIEVQASIDISINENDYDRRLFTDDCFGVNDIRGNGGKIIILFKAIPIDNNGNKF